MSGWLRSLGRWTFWLLATSLSFTATVSIRMLTSSDETIRDHLPYALLFICLPIVLASAAGPLVMSVLSLALLPKLGRLNSRLVMIFALVDEPSKPSRCAIDSISTRPKSTVVP